jgi:serine/threonine protein phosphatase PrpC
MTFKAAVASCPGKTYSHNNDNFYFNSKIITEELSTSQILLSHKKGQKGLQIYAVSDGSGINTYKDSPSMLVMSMLLKYHKKILSDESYDLRVCLHDYIKTANRAVLDKSRETGKKLKATLAMIFVEENAGICCNIGHSRIYKFNHGNLEKMSVDHTQAMRMVNLGLLTEEKAKVHPKRGKLLQNLGPMPEGIELEPNIELFPIEENDVFILGTFGFYDNVSDEKIIEILSLGKSPAETVELLMTEAVHKGLEDDATVLVVKAYGDDAVAPVRKEKVAAPPPRPKSTNKAAIYTPAAEEEPRRETGIDDERTSDEPVTLAGAFRDLWRSLGRSKDANTIHWPAFTVFVLCIVLVGIMSMFGVKLFNRYANEHNLFPTATYSTIAPGVVTPTPGPSDTEPVETPTPVPSETPTEGPTEEPTEEPTAEPTTEPTQGPTPEPTTEPTTEPADNGTNPGTNTGADNGANTRTDNRVNTGAYNRAHTGAYTGTNNRTHTGTNSGACRNRRAIINLYIANQGDNK